MFHVYFIKSQVNGDIYIGSCEVVSTRVASHNLGKVKSTKGYCPWKLLAYKEFTTRSEAVRMEKFYKTGQQREILKKQFRDS